MTGLSTLLRKELLEQWRTARLPVVATVFLLVGLTSPLLARFTPEILKAVGGGQFQIVLPPPTVADAYDQLAKNLGQFGAFIAILLAMGSVATEKERGTAALILTKPVSRASLPRREARRDRHHAWHLHRDRRGGSLVLHVRSVRAAADRRIAAAAVLQWLALVAYAAITFLGSTLTRSALAAAGLGVAAFIVLGILGIVPAIGRYLPAGLGATARGLALGQAGVDVLGPAIAAVALIGVTVVVAWLAFRRQEL